MDWLNNVDGSTAFTILSWLLGAGGISAIVGTIVVERRERRRDEQQRKEREEQRKEREEQRKEREEQRLRLHEREIGRLMERMHAAEKINASTGRMMDVFHNEYYELLHPRNEDDEDPSTAQRPSGAAHGTA